MFDSLSIPTILVSYVALLFSLSVHEASHATAAYLLEDDTAARLGRMTLNPLAHMDLLGTFVFPLLGMATGFPFIGWAKPVPVDPRKLTRRFTQRVGYAFVASAGPASNLVQAVLFLGIMLMMVKVVAPTPRSEYPLFLGAWSMTAMRRMQLGVGTTLAFALLTKLVIINIGLALFNLLPMGPLDGAGILRGFLPWRWLPKFDRAQPWMGGILIALAIVPLPLGGNWIPVLPILLSPVFDLVEHGIDIVARLVLHF